MFRLNIDGVPEWVRLEVQPHGYAVGPRTTRVELRDEHGSVLSRLSVNLPDQPELTYTEWFWLKDWAENAQIVAALIADKRIEIVPGVTPVESGHVTIKCARLA